MNEAIGSIGGRNDRRRRLRITRKRLKRLKEKYERQKYKKLKELEKKVKIIQIATFFKSLAIILPVEQLKQIMARKNDVDVNSNYTLKSNTFHIVKAGDNTVQKFVISTIKKPSKVIERLEKKKNKPNSNEDIILIDPANVKRGVFFKRKEQQHEEDINYDIVLLKMDEIIEKASGLLNKLMSSSEVYEKYYLELVDRYTGELKKVVDIDEMEYSHYYKSVCYKKFEFDSVIKDIKHELSLKAKSDEVIDKTTSDKKAEKRESDVKKIEGKKQEEKSKQKYKSQFMNFLYRYSSMLLFIVLGSKGNNSFLGTRNLVVSLLVNLYIMNHINDKNFSEEAVEEYKKMIEKEANDMYGVLAQLKRALIEVEVEIDSVKRHTYLNDDIYYEKTLSNLQQVRSELIYRIKDIEDQMLKKTEYIKRKK